MSLEEILGTYVQHAKVNEAAEKCKSSQQADIHIKGIVGSGLAFVSSAMVNKLGGTHLFIFNDKEEAAYFFNDLENIWETKNLNFFPASYKNPYADEKADSANLLFRTETLDNISKGKKANIIVSYPEAICEKVVTQTHLKSNTLSIKIGDKLSIDFINELLFDYEFERVDFVSEPGEFAIRGGIVDIFSYSNDFPYRLEFFGDEIESMRTFDPDDQRSVKAMGKIHIIPNVQEKLLKESRDSVFNFLPANTHLWVKDYQFTTECIAAEYERMEGMYLNSKTALQLPPKELYIDATYFSQKVSLVPLFIFGPQAEKHFDLIDFKQKPQPAFNKNFELLIDNFRKNEQNRIDNVVVSNNPRQIERLYRIFEDIGKEVNFTGLSANFNEGFIDEDLKIAFYTDHQIFERYHRFKLKDGFHKSRQSITIKELISLQKGDFITHIDHGIGIFDGLEKIEADGKMQEAVRLLYRDNDLLYVSIHSLHRISKYTSKEGQVPSLNKLGSPAWQNVKNKTKSKVKRIAYDLIKLYAARKSKRGFAFSPDTYLQHELESSFMFEDTPDQESATADTKKDMEQDWPMDRLVCGDVGFGKTEIAIRAAFKAVCDSKQVAVLVPTTILSTQHFHTFSNRLKDFPVNVDYINRFKSAKAQKETIEKLKTGEIDILIGTHRITGKDVKFKDLGLLVIDEEQKFGVAVKDKLKTLRVNVDTLTLTATPIPRTLQFSLMKARDLSIINTPPPNRHPVKTEVKPFSEEVIRDAIYYEVSRNGQVFFVHNRVQNIQEVSALISKICPEVKVKYAHGQMQGEVLEQVMMEFINNEFDVLVATTIIESGLDISNANTIIINQAQNFGLSDLHQMRGRVGRSNKKAFCYLLCPPISTLPTKSRKRLEALEQFSDLGSGFNIAMKDLDIRGAGNLLGGEQSGFIAEVGFEMYQKILDEAIEELKEHEFKGLFEEEEKEANEEKTFVRDTQVETDLEILIPDTYVNNLTERLKLYQQLSEISHEAELQDFETMLKDRFGDLPEISQSLMNSIRLKWHANSLGFEKVRLLNERLLCYFVSDQNSAYFQSQAFQKILQFLQQNPSKGIIKEKNHRLYISFSKIKSIENALHLVMQLSGEKQSQLAHQPQETTNN